MPELDESGAGNNQDSGYTNKYGNGFIFYNGSGGGFEDDGCGYGYGDGYSHGGGFSFVSGWEGILCQN